MATHPILAHYLRFSATTAGRDKLLRTVQFFSRFCASALQRTKWSQGAIELFDSIQKQFGMTRKILRIGKFLDLFNAISLALGDQSTVDPIIRFLSIGSQLGYAGFFVLDTITVFHAMGAHRLQSGKRMMKAANISWSAGLFCSALANSYVLLAPQEKENQTISKEGASSEASRERRRERSAALGQIVSDVCDSSISTTALGVATYDERLVGIAGVISSIIGVHNQWCKSAQEN